MTKLQMPEELRAFFRACNARRKREPRACASCGAAIPDALLRQRYCSHACTQRAYYRRKRARQRATQAPLPLDAPER
jgi:predicted nucleic acid-binding Zn ribbon protein